MMGQASGQQFFSRAVRFTVFGVKIRKAFGLNLKLCFSRTDVSVVVGASLSALEEPM